MTNKRVGVEIGVGVTGAESLDKLAQSINEMGVDTKLLDAQAAELAAELKTLAEQQALIDAFKRQKQTVADAGAAMDAAKAKAGELGREIGASEAPTKKQEAAFAKARTAARDASEAYTAQRLALQNLRAATASAGVSTESLAEAQRRVKAELAQAQDNLRATAEWAQRLATAERAAAAQGTALASTTTSTSAALRQTAAAAREAVTPLEGVAGTLRNLAGVGVAGILGSQTAQMLRGVAETADAYANLQARIKLVTGEGPAFTAAMAGIGEIALRTNSNLETTGGLFARLAQAGKEIGVGQEAALALTESINQAVQLSGASATASDAAITQLVQGLQGGVLRGDEFNSVMEQAPRLAQALAAGLGVTTGELRKMAEAGQLSAETVIRALQSQSATLQREFGSLPATVGRAIENLNTKWTLFIGGLNSGTGATATVASGINALANHLEELAGVATRAGSVLVAALAVQAVGALQGLAAQMAASGGAAALLSQNLNAIPKVINIAVAAVGFEVGFQIGQLLYENSSLARKLGVGITEFFTGLVNDLQFLAEAGKAIFTSDTIGAAFDRYKKRAEEQRAIFQDLYADAEKSPEVVRAAAAAAAAETKGLGDKAVAAGAQVAVAGQAGAAGLAATTAAAGGATAAVQGTGSAAATAAQAIGGLAEAAKTAGRENTLLTPNLTAQAEALVKVALAGRKAADTLRTELPEAISKLSGSELEQFRVTMTRALTQAIGDAQRLADTLGAGSTAGAIALGKVGQATQALQTVLQAVGTQAAQSLGVDVNAASKQVSDGFKTAEQNLATLVNSLPALAKAGVDTGAVVGQALAKMIDGAKNQAEVDAIIARVNALGVEGKISGQQVAGAFDQANAKVRALKEAAEDASPGIQSLGEAARKAGVEVVTLTGGISKGFKDGLQPVSDLVDEVIKAGVAAEKSSPVLAAALNKRIEAAQTKEELALVRAEIERAAAAGKLFGDATSTSLDKVKAKAKELNPELNRINDAIRKMGGTPIGEAVPNGSQPKVLPGGPGAIDEGPLRQKFFDNAQANTDAARGWTYAKDGFVMQNGQRFTASGQLQPPDDSGDWEFVGDVRASGSGSANTRVVPNQGYWVRNGGGSTIGSSGSATGAGSLGTSGGAAGAGALVADAAGTTRVDPTQAADLAALGAAAQRQAAVPTSHSITITLPSGQSRTFNAASAADARGMSDWLAQLATDAASASGG